MVDAPYDPFASQKGISDQRAARGFPPGPSLSSDRTSANRGGSGSARKGPASDSAADGWVFTLVWQCLVVVVALAAFIAITVAPILWKALRVMWSVAALAVQKLLAMLNGDKRH